MLRITLLTLLCGVLVACDYRVPLTRHAELAIDPDVLGLWATRDGESTRQLLILPLGAKEYLLSFPAGSEHAMFARATPVRVDDRVLIQLRWLGDVQGNQPDDDRYYQYGRYRWTAGRLETGLVDPQVVSKDIETSAELRAALRTRMDDPALFHQPRTFTRVEP